RPAGGGGVPRSAVRRAIGTHPRGGGDLPEGVAPGTPAIQRTSLSPPTAARSGNRTGQAAEADQPPGARTHPDLHRRTRTEERAADRRDRGRLATGFRRPRTHRLGVG